MPESPPKRVTRARAKATNEFETVSKKKKITSASTKVAAESKPAVQPAKVTKRKAKVDNGSEGLVQEPIIITQAALAPIKSRGRPKKVGEETNGAIKDVSTSDALPRTRSRQEKDIALPDEGKDNEPKPRGRPRKIVDKGEERPTRAQPKEKEPDPIKKTVRGRTTTVVAKPSTNSTLKPTTIRKKVTFRDDGEQNKENRDGEMTVAKDSQPKLTGLRAKPMRKPAITKIARGKKELEAQKPEDRECKEDEVSIPLSPKKVKQVAKVGSISSEDELCGEKTPMRALSKSPVKAAISAFREPPKSVSKLDFAPAITGKTSPTKGASSVLASPARRPPPSPFKDALKESPKRVNLGSSVTRALFTPQQTSLKTSLLQSAARRPTSPTKLATSYSPERNSKMDENIDLTKASTENDISELLAVTPQKVTSSTLQAVESSEKSLKVHEKPADERQAIITADEASHEKENCLEQLPGEDTSVAGICDIVPSSSPNKDIGRSLPPISPELAKEHVEQQDTEVQTDLSNSSNSEHSENLAVSQGMRRPGSPDASIADAFSLSSHALKYNAEESDSEDELQSACKTIKEPRLVMYNTSIVDFGGLGSPTPGTLSKMPNTTSGSATVKETPISLTKDKDGLPHKVQDFSMTPLAMQLSSWFAASPEKDTPGAHTNQHHGIFSPAGPNFTGRSRRTRESVPAASPLKSTFFEDEMAVREQQVEPMEEEQQSQNLADPTDVGASQESQDSEEYGDENALPVNSHILGMHQESYTSPETCTPARVFYQNPREIHTVSRVPLRPAADDTPMRVTRKRSRSMSGPLAVVDKAARPRLEHDSTVIPYSNKEAISTSPNITIPIMPSTPEHDTWSQVGTPFRTTRKGADAEILRGAVVYVDVHTTEGADASNIFVELLTQMGAKCVKQWTWNPRTSVTSAMESTTDGQSTPSDGAALNGKVGITHVVYKDGGKRTLEKVRESKGLVLCVGVGWVLE